MTFPLFGTDIAVYGVIVAFSILAAFVTGLIIFKVLNWKEDIAFLIVLLCVPAGIILARFYYVIFSLDEFRGASFFEIINPRGGGMAIYGGIIGGALGLFAVARIKKVGFFALADIGAICLILAQAIGRWGNFVNQEAYGLLVSKHVPPFTVLIDDCHYCLTQGCAHLATYLYESVLSLIGFGVLLFLFFHLRKKGKYNIGTISGAYLIWYGVTRAIIEPLRTDSLLMFGSNAIVFNRVSFMLSIALIAIGVLILIAAKKKWISQEYEGCLKDKKTNKSEATKTDT